MRLLVFAAVVLLIAVVAVSIIALLYTLPVGVPAPS
jgi:hypothetical protein